MLERTLDGQSQTGDDELLIAAHYALNFARPLAERLAPLADRLAGRPGSAAAIMSWAISFDEAIDIADVQRRHAFERAILALADNGCLYTKVFRVLFQRLGEAEAL